ncbi:MAG: ferrous iron transport protein A [Synergistetes bacterium]|nr:ferrous iron transport protein A [Synergistota bacterium]
MKDVISLDRLREGERGRVVSIMGGRGFRMRLIQLGVMPGIEVRVSKSAFFGGPIMIEVNNTRVALGKGVASRIWVERIS